MNRIIITGGAGFIGSNIAKSYLDNGNYEVYIFDDFSSGRRDNLQKNSNLFIHEIDLKNEINKWPEINAEIIFNCMGISRDTIEFVNNEKHLQMDGI